MFYNLKLLINRHTVLFFFRDRQTTRTLGADDNVMGALALS